jgi:hypothetical protein
MSLGRWGGGVLCVQWSASPKAPQNSRLQGHPKCGLPKPRPTVLLMATQRPHSAHTLATHWPHTGHTMAAGKNCIGHTFGRGWVKYFSVKHVCVAEYGQCIFYQWPMRGQCVANVWPLCGNCALQPPGLKTGDVPKMTLSFLAGLGPRTL